MVYFFLKAVREQADKNKEKATNILNLYESKKEEIVECTHSQHAIRAIDFLFENPIFRSSTFTNSDNIPNPTAHRILKLLKESNIVKIIRDARGSRPATFMFPELLNITEGRQIF